jgi:hypothetical protein
LQHRHYHYGSSEVDLPAQICRARSYQLKIVAPPRSLATADLTLEQVPIVVGQVSQQYLNLLYLGL